MLHHLTQNGGLPPWIYLTFISQWTISKQNKKSQQAAWRAALGNQQQTKTLNDISSLSCRALGRATESKLDPCRIHRCWFYRRFWGTSQSLKCSRKTFYIKHSLMPLLTSHLPPLRASFTLSWSCAWERMQDTQGHTEGMWCFSLMSEGLSNRQGLKLLNYGARTLPYKR